MEFGEDDGPWNAGNFKLTIYRTSMDLEIYAI